MKTTEDRIIDYLYGKTKGMLKLRPQHAQDIIAIVQGSFTSGIGHATVKKFRYNGMSGTYELYRTIVTTQDLINQRIREALEVGPVERSYKYELYTAAGDFEGNILSMNANLFD